MAGPEQKQTNNNVLPFICLDCTLGEGMWTLLILTFILLQSLCPLIQDFCNKYWIFRFVLKKLRIKKMGYKNWVCVKAFRFLGGCGHLWMGAEGTKDGGLLVSVFS